MPGELQNCKMRQLIDSLNYYLNGNGFECKALTKQFLRAIMRAFPARENAPHLRPSLLPRQASGCPISARRPGFHDIILTVRRSAQ